MIRAIEEDEISRGRDVASVDLDTPSEIIAHNTYQLHPPNQCRIDIMVAGALCNVAEPYVLDENNPFVGTCATGVGARPSCWFRK